MSPRLVVAEKGCDSVKLIFSSSEKQSVTAIGAITADGRKLPLWVIAKGRTQRCLKKFGEHPNIQFHHTESGWTTESVMMRFLDAIHQDAGGCPCCLVLDLYPSHRTEAVIKRAEELDIELIFVPAGLTSKLQPLDIRVFGELKSRARAEFQRIAVHTGSRDIELHSSINILIKCWERISPENIIKAWGVILHNTE